MSIYRIVIAIFILSTATITAQKKAEKVELIDMVKDLIITKKQEISRIFYFFYSKFRYKPTYWF